MTNDASAPPSDLLNDLTVWYEKYTRSFLGHDPELDDAVHLKYDHTQRVCAEMNLLCDSLGLYGRIRTLAGIAALLHDVARFEQFRQYRTFSDSRSTDHAERACDIIVECRLLDFSKHEEVIAAIRYHNSRVIPEELSGNGLLLCRMLRDADKLDIYKIAIEHFIRPQSKRRETVQVGIPDGSTATPEVCKAVLRRESVPYGQVRNVIDFKILQLGWVFDLNFSHSIRCVKERGYISRLKAQIPQTPLVGQVVELVERFLDQSAPM